MSEIDRRSRYERSVTLYHVEMSFFHHLKVTDENVILNLESYAANSFSLDQALKLLASTTKIPEFHSERVKLYEYAYKAALVNRNFENAFGSLASYVFKYCLT